MKMVITIVIILFLFGVLVGVTEEYNPEPVVITQQHQEDSLYQIWRDSTHLRISFKIWYNKYNKTHDRNK